MLAGESAGEATNMADDTRPDRKMAIASPTWPPAARPDPVAHPDGSSSQKAAYAENNSPDPATTAIVVIDVQRLFTEMVGAPIAPPLREVLPAIGRLLEAGRGAGATIVLVRTIIALDAHSRSTREWPPFMRAGLAPGAPGTGFDPCLNHQATDIEVVKQRYSAFFATPLDQILRPRGIQSVVVLGLTTNVCVQSTARDAWQRDYETVTLSDCCAEIGEGSHEASLMWTSRNFGRVTTSDALILEWRERSKRPAAAASANASGTASDHGR
jgi:ureidoacrylate peracid hydrolase